MILKYELKKIFSKKINKIVLIAAMVLAVVFSGFAITSVRYSDRDGVVHTGVTAARKLAADKNKWKGKLTEEKLAEVVKSRQEYNKKYGEAIPDEEYGETIQSYNDICAFLISVLTPDSEYDGNVLYQLTEEQTEDIYVVYQDHIRKMVEEYGETKEQQKFLKKQYAKIQIPPVYKSADSWGTMVLYAETYGIILAVICGFLAAGIFAEEFHNHADAVFFAAKYGRTKAAKSKVIAGLLVTTIVYWVGMGLLSLISFGVMGVSGFGTPYQLEQPYSIYPMTYGQYYLLAVVCGYIASLLAASVTMLTAAKMRTASVAVCIPFFLFCVMPFIGRMFASYFVFFRLTPDLLLNVMGCVKDLKLFQVGGIVFRQVPVLMLLYAVISVLLLPFVYKSYCGYGLKKK